MFPVKVGQGRTLLSCLSSHIVNKCPFHGLFTATFFTFLCFLLMISLPNMGPKNSVAVLPSVPKHEKAVLCLMKKTHVLDKLLSGYWP